ncbi:hypothetical protein H8L32_22670 [Undibacterium sp. CY18W]|uniref:Uncharacterized protein n=1 Tax=Undibacterium hunanense TaxID=2762292 RepID=A0ABR6ZWP7_9BURK|nr:hypothetical protein [Undibacterium hunanense]MBC3920286.1 hypothetical protein [Undibacterium hunanense]
MNEDQLRAELKAVYTSSSWRITAPLRLVSQLLKSGGWQKLYLDTRRLVKKTRAHPVEVRPLEVKRDDTERLGPEGRKVLIELQNRIKHNKHME